VACADDTTAGCRSDGAGGFEDACATLTIESSCLAVDAATNAGTLDCTSVRALPGRLSALSVPQRSSAAEMPEVRVMCLAYLSLQQSGREREGEREQRERESSERVR
jgi:hypothetical protein